ncbi:MAG: transcription antitermination factor NusB [Candidatus Lindowbacteria bacterium]|nr:transcription antitermination factor NusB [Candidatus Lindowbacteria bacterium]
MRRKARELAFHIIFEASYLEEEFKKDIDGQIQNYFRAHENPDIQTKEFVIHLVKGVLDKLSELDEEIAAAATNWRLDRFDRVTLNLLRLATFELKTPDQGGVQLGPEIVIDEAIELAKIYGGDDVPGFINGILDALAGLKKAKN